MKGPARVLLAVVVIVAGCSSEPVVSQPTAPEAVELWIAALDGAGDPGEFVIDGQVALLAALGRPGDAAEIVAGGLSTASEAAYWRSLAEGMAETSGLDLSELAVGDVAVRAVGGVDYAFVDVVGNGGSTVIVVRMAEETTLVDLVATIGPELVRPLATLLESLDPGSIDGPAIAASLLAGIADPGLDLPPQFYGEVQDLIASLDA